MPRLQFEKDQLILADTHLAQAEVHVKNMRDHIDGQELQGLDTSISRRMLAAALDSLAAFREHRELIVRTIADIEAGRLPST